MNIRLLWQPPYSPDLNMCDSYIFPRLESIHDDFESGDDLRQFFTNKLPKFTAYRINKTLDELILTMEILIEVSGSYFCSCFS